MSVKLIKLKTSFRLKSSQKLILLSSIFIMNKLWSFFILTKTIKIIQSGNSFSIHYLYSDANTFSFVNEIIELANFLKETIFQAKV